MQRIISMQASMQTLFAGIVFSMGLIILSSSAGASTLLSEGTAGSAFGWPGSYQSVELTFGVSEASMESTHALLDLTGVDASVVGRVPHSSPPGCCLPGVNSAPTQHAPRCCVAPGTRLQ